MSRSSSLLALFGPLSALTLAACGEVAPDSSPLDSAGPAASFEAAPVHTAPEGTRLPVAVDADGDGSPAGTDCNDADATAYPGAVEADDLADDDCDGWVDETFVAAGDVVVTEINRQSRIGTVLTVNDASWVEVQNTSSRTVDLANWVLSRGASAPYNSVTLDPATAPVLAPGEYAVFCDTDNYQASATSAYPLTCDYVWGDETQAASYVGTYHDNTFYLRRDSDRVSLFIEGSRTTGRLVDAVRWYYDATNGYWPRNARFSMSLDPAYRDASSNDLRSTWCSTTENAAGTVSYSSTWRWYDVSAYVYDEYGTPGAANFDCPVDPDLDGDGYTGTDDCDDTDPAINPAASETCDGVDQDCDGLVDDGVGSTTWYLDADADGYGDAATGVVACVQPASTYLADATDCDDSDSASYPGGFELCDGADNDCDGSVDDGASGTTVFFADSDADGYGDPDVTTLSCTAPSGYTDNDNDCDDALASVSPDAAEGDNLTDDDCDGWVDEDFIAVGDIVVTEINRQARFGATATVNDGSWVEVQNTSSRSIDLSNWVLSRGAASPYNSVTLDPAAAPLLAPGEYAVFCDSATYQGSSGAAYPLACDYVWGDATKAASYVGTYHDNTFYLRRDTDAVGLYLGGSRTTGTRIDGVTWYYDATNGYWPRNGRFSMSLDPAYADGTLNDVRAAWCSTNESATGSVSNDSTYRWYDVTTTINDEYGTPGAANYNCPVDPDLDGDGYTGATDCDEGNAAVNPGATETCNGIDDDCDGTVDDSAGGSTWYTDGDGDGYGAGTGTVACTAPSGTVSNASDCDDSASGVNPGAAEVCNDGVDNDCDPDPTVCEWSGSQTVKADYDFRAYGTAASYSVGHAVANNGDFNGDGYDDVVVGQAYHDNGATLDVGRTLVWYGPVSTSDGLDTADVGIVGSLASDQFGWQATFAGDVDGDGTDDLLSSAWKAETNDRGRAYLFLGGTTPTSVSSAFATFAPADANNFTGQAIGGGDYDGDGRADVLVSAYGRSSSAGAVGIWASSAIGGGAENLTADYSLFVSSATAGANLGYSATFASDIDGDGLDDLLLGAPATASTTTPGAVYVWYGVDALSGSIATSTADATLSGTANGDRFGLAVASLGDTNGDGGNDFAISADKEDSAATDAGAVYVFTSAPSGSATGASLAATTFRGQVASDFFGRSLSRVGDVNGDGFADMFVGATGYDDGALSGAGAVYLWYGPFPAGTASAAGYDYRMLGANTSDAVGYAVGGGGDVNADGIDDFMTAAPSWDGFGYLNSGGAWLYYGQGE